jgi:hypothetical protein
MIILGEKNMSAELELRWLKTENVEGAVQRFAKFCKDDIKEQSKKADFDLANYQEAVKLVLQKLDKTNSVKEIFNAD